MLDITHAKYLALVTFKMVSSFLLQYDDDDYLQLTCFFDFTILKSKLNDLFL